MKYMIMNKQATMPGMSPFAGKMMNTTKSIGLTNLDNQSFYSMNSSAHRGGAKGSSRRNVTYNPIYGYNIISFKAVKPGTTIYRIRHDIFKHFFAPENIKKWHEKEVERKFPKQVRFENASKKIKEQIFSSMTLRSFDPNDVMLRAGTMPNELMFLVSGKIQILQKADDLIEPDKNALKV